MSSPCSVPVLRVKTMKNRATEIFDRGMRFERQAQFEKAKAVYKDLFDHATDERLLGKIKGRMGDIDDLIKEKAIYRRIDENAKQVLTHIGINISQTPVLMDLLMEADGVDFDNETALFIPLKRNYIDHCLAQVPRKMTADPGKNAFGTGSTSPFLKRPGEQDLRPANRREYEKIIHTVADHRDVVKIFSLPVACDKSISLFEIAGMMEKNYPGLKMIPSNTMGDEEVLFFKDKADWLDGTSLITALAPMASMVAPFLRSARTGNPLLLIDQSLSGISGPASPEAFLTQVHAQVIFMMVVAQTVNPGIACVHGGIPCLVDAGGNLAYSGLGQTLINAALARVNTWITGFPSAQTGGSTRLDDVGSQALSDSQYSRNTLRRYGVHIVRHAMGALGSLNFFSLEKFLGDCEAERALKKRGDAGGEDNRVIPMYFPADPDALAGIGQIAEKGNPRNADHTLKNVDAFSRWEDRVTMAGKINP